MDRSSYSEIRYFTVGSPWFLQIPNVAYSKLQPSVWIELSVNNCNTFVPDGRTSQLRTSHFATEPELLSYKASCSVCAVYQVSLSSDLSGRTKVVGWKCG